MTGPADETPADAAARVRDGDDLLVDASRPAAVAAALRERTDLSDVRAYVYGFPYTTGEPITTLAATPGVDVFVSMRSPPLEEADVTFLPRSIFTAATAPPLADPQRRTVFLGQAPPAAGVDQPLGPVAAFAEGWLDRADLALLERNARLPALPNGRSLPTERFDAVVETARDPPCFPEAEPDEATRAVAANVRPLVPDDATLQLGVGSVAHAVGAAIEDAGDLSVWSGLVGEPVRDLVERGVTDSAVGCVAIGTDPSFYEWVADVEAFDLRPALMTHNPARMRDLDRFVAVNSALAVDLQGQVNAEVIGGTQISGTGGQPDFAAGGSTNPDGISVIALPARTGGGTARVVERIPEDGVVTTPRYHVDHVVTDHGRAAVTARGGDDREEAIAGVAHPDDRATLRE